MDWDKKAKENLIPLSKEQTKLDVALLEWYFTGIVFDHIVPSETCQICEKTGLRYHYEIKNTDTENILLVGSSCILRFDIAVYGDSGELLKGKEKEKKLTNKIREFQTEVALESLRQLWRVSDKKLQNLIASFVESFKERKGFSPKQLLLLYKELRKNKIHYEPTYYRVTLRLDWDKDKLLKMSDQDLKLIWPSLSPNQQRNYPKLKQKKKEEEEQLEKITREREEIRKNQQKYSSSIEANISQAYELHHPNKLTQFNEYTRKEEAVCVLCGQITRDWWYYDGTTKTCKCNECKNYGKS